MLCTNCGAQFEGNFCPRCGTPAAKPAVPVRPPEKSYPAPPLGRYKSSDCPSIVVGENSITNDKKNLENWDYFNSHVEILFSDIAAVRFEERGPRASVSIRTKENCDIPFAEGSDILGDPFCVMFGKDKETATRVYDFLKTVAEINAYPVPPHPVLPHGFQFRSLCPDVPPRVPTVKERIRENQKNGVACCPKCGSTSLSANKKGFGVGKAAVGALVSWPLGLAAGALGSGKTVVTCLNCGYKWKL